MGDSTQQSSHTTGGPLEAVAFEEVQFDDGVIHYLDYGALDSVEDKAIAVTLYAMHASPDSSHDGEAYSQRLVGNDAAAYGLCPATKLCAEAPEGMRAVNAFAYATNGVLRYARLRDYAGGATAYNCLASNLLNWIEDRCIGRVMGCQSVAELALYEVVTAKRGNRLQIRIVGRFGYVGQFDHFEDGRPEIDSPSIILEGLQIQERTLEVRAFCLHVFAQGFFMHLMDEMRRLWGEATPPAGVLKPIPPHDEGERREKVRELKLKGYSDKRIKTAIERYAPSAWTVRNDLRWLRENGYMPADT